jgi:hypothetical protein
MLTLNPITIILIHFYIGIAIEILITNLFFNIECKDELLISIKECNSKNILEAGRIILLIPYFVDSRRGTSLDGFVKSLTVNGVFGNGISNLMNPTSGYCQSMIYLFSPFIILFVDDARNSSYL